tara:strand:+ start:2936 stop:3070 length:135 start_codon:yes stop_codon:yes gene_type:complete
MKDVRVKAFVAQTALYIGTYLAPITSKLLGNLTNLSKGNVKEIL